MRWIALALGTTVAGAGLAWALVTTGHWPLDDRRQPALAFYALNGALGRWLVDHGERVPMAIAVGRGEPGGAARVFEQPAPAAGSPGRGCRRR